MSIKNSLIFAGIVVAVAALAPALAVAEPSDQPATNAALASGESPASGPAEAFPRVQPPSKPAVRAAKKEATASPWTIKDALPDRSVALRQYEPPPSPGLGRLPLKSGQGSFGFETETKLKSNETPEGRIIPGLEPTNHKGAPSFLGLSLSMPTSGTDVSDRGSEDAMPRPTPR